MTLLMAYRENFPTSGLKTPEVCRDLVTMLPPRTLPDIEFPRSAGAAHHTPLAIATSLEPHWQLTRAAATRHALRA